LGKSLATLEDTIKQNKVAPLDLHDVSDPDDDEIEKMILNDDERSLKTRMWK